MKQLIPTPQEHARLMGQFMEQGESKAERHMQICHALNSIYKSKNHDYGDSFGESFEEWGTVAAVVRMDDKMRRIKQLAKTNDAKVNESLADSVLDLANYSIMLLIELGEGNG